jgi:hypothetical protein
VVRSLWASVQGNPVFMRKVNGWLTVFWIVMIPVSIETGWVTSVTYVSALSLWALVAGHWSTWQAARVEVTQQEEMARQKDGPVAEAVVDEILERTEVEPAKPQRIGLRVDRASPRAQSVPRRAGKWPACRAGRGNGINRGRARRRTAECRSRPGRTRHLRPRRCRRGRSVAAARTCSPGWQPERRGRPLVTNPWQPTR